MACIRPLRWAAALSLPILVAWLGLATARADELSDLRANNELLAQKLAQARALNGDTAPPPRDAAKPPLQGSFPGSLLIPGTRTSVRIGGNITTIGNYTLEQ
ncbi:MAG TPA: hypothetical protein VND87_01365 [Stellaceae bacterium]|nr:hypothetical protein [Stellaceae bacterium]